MGFLLYAGIIILATYFLGIVLSCAKKCAEKDGEVSCMENCGICFLNMINFCLILADFGTLIWGSIVVFGSYSSWVSEVDPSLSLPLPTTATTTPSCSPSSSSSSAGSSFPS